jgi:cell division transport system permease protein
MMQTKFLKLGRTFKEGGVNFYRNGWLSFATVSILAISLYIISFTAIAGIAAGTVLSSIQDKINVSVYFKPDVSEVQIMDIKNKLSVYSEIKSIEFVSREKALEDFKKMGDENPTIDKALAEIGENPLLSALVIKAKDPLQYNLIAKSIRESSFNEFINNINYQQNKSAIERLGTIIKLVSQVGITIGVVFVFIGILITFNAIRLTMYAQKQEFEVKRLVGASNIYIRMPFVFEGMFYGLVSAFLVIILLGITIKYASPITEGNMTNGNLMGFYWANFFKIFGSLILSGIFLGVISGVIAIRRYLKI